MWLLAVNFVDITLDYRGRWSHAAGKSLLAMLLYITLEGASKEGQFHHHLFLPWKSMKTKKKKRRFLGSAERKIKVEAGSGKHQPNTL